MTYNVEDERHERTPLLTNNGTTPARRPITPLPKLQIAIVLLLQVCEPITSQSIFPYINQVRRHDCAKILMLIDVVSSSVNSMLPEEMNAKLDIMLD